MKYRQRCSLHRHFGANKIFKIRFLLLIYCLMCSYSFYNYSFTSCNLHYLFVFPFYDHCRTKFLLVFGHHICSFACKYVHYHYTKVFYCTFPMYDPMIESVSKNAYIPPLDHDFHIIIAKILGILAFISKSLTFKSILPESWIHIHVQVFPSLFSFLCRCAIICQENEKYSPKFVY